MASLQEIENAFINAHEAGDKEAAGFLASELRSMIATQEAPQPIARPSTQTPNQAPSDVNLDFDATPSLSVEDMRRLKGRQAQRSLDRDIYGLPIVGGLYKGAKDMASGGAQLLARGVDAIAGSDLSSDFDKRIIDDERLYQAANQGKPLQDVARVGMGFLGGTPAASATGAANIASKYVPEAVQRVATGAAVGAGTSPVLMEKVGDQGEYAAQKALQAGAGLVAGGVLEAASPILQKLFSKTGTPKERDVAVNKFVDSVKDNLTYKSPKDITRYKQVIKRILERIKAQPELYSEDSINKAFSRYTEMKKAGFDPDINDVMDFAFSGEVSAMRGSSGDLVARKVSDVDIVREKQGQQLLSNLQTGTPRDKAQLGQEISDALLQKREAFRKAEGEKLRPLYQQSKYTPEGEFQELEAQKIQKGIYQGQQSINIDPKAFKTIDSPDLVVPTTKKRLRSAKGLYPDLRMQARPDYLKKGKNWTQQDLDSIPLNSVENIHHARRIIDGEISAAKKIGNRTEMANLQIQRDRIDNLLKQSPEFAEADQIFQNMMEKIETDDLSKFGNLIKAGEKVNSFSGIQDNLFSDKTTTRQFQNIINELERPIEGASNVKRIDILSTMINDVIGKLDDKTNIDTVYNKLFNTKNKRDKIAILTGGRSTPLFKKFNTTMEALKNLKQTKSFARGSTTANKIEASEKSQALLDNLDLGVALQGGSASKINYVIRKISKFFPVNENKLNRQGQEILFEFFVNPKNTKRTINLLQDMRKVSSQDNASKLINNNYNELKSIFGQGTTRGLSQATQSLPENDKNRVTYQPLDADQKMRDYFKKHRAAKKQPSFDNIIENIFEEEGGYVANDAGAGETNFGINKRANPDIDVKNLTKDKAASIYKKRYWDKIKADDLEPAMQVIAMDAAVNQGVGWTRNALKKAKGDIQKFKDLRIQRYKNIANNPSKKKYLKSWLGRVDKSYNEALKYV